MYRGTVPRRLIEKYLVDTHLVDKILVDRHNVRPILWLRLTRQLIGRQVGAYTVSTKCLSVKLFSTKRRESERYEEEQERCPVDLKKEETPFLIKSNLAGKTAFTGVNAFFSRHLL